MELAPELKAEIERRRNSRVIGYLVCTDEEIAREILGEWQAQKEQALRQARANKIERKRKAQKRVMKRNEKFGKDLRRWYVFYSNVFKKFSDFKKLPIPRKIKNGVLLIVARGISLSSIIKELGEECPLVFKKIRRNSVLYKGFKKGVSRSYAKWVRCNSKNVDSVFKKEELCQRLMNGEIVDGTNLLERLLMVYYHLAVVDDSNIWTNQWKILEKTNLDDDDDEDYEEDNN